jgi:hypothetical protein
MSAARGEDGVVIRLAAMLAGAAHTFASRRRFGALAAAPLAVAIALSACGSSGSDDVTIPKANSEQLLADLTQVQDASAAQDCQAAKAAAKSFVADVNALPIEVGTDAKAAMRDAGERLTTLTQDCTPPAGTSDQLSSTTPVAPTTSTATTATTTTSTSTSTSTSTESQPPPDQNPGEGNGPPGGGGGEGGSGGSGGTGGGKTR